MAKAKPDGYTLLLTTDSAAVANPLLYKNLSYNFAEAVSQTAKKKSHKGTS